MNKAKIDKPDLKGEDLTAYARATYPSAFDVKKQFNNVVNFINKVGEK